MRRAILLAFFGFITTIAACSGRADVYEACPVSGQIDACVDGAICAKAVNGALICQFMCNDSKNCPQGTDCQGVAGTNLKSCRPTK